jgi:hypothetical protein
MNSAVHIGNVTCGPGEIRFGGIPTVCQRDGSELNIPLIVVNGVKEGPTLWLGALGHGSEIPGWEVARRVVREEIDPKLLRGTVMACMAQNPLAYMDSGRLTPSDGVNINRVFPGKPDGSLTERLAHDLFKEGIERADAVFDFHSNAIGAISFTLVRSGLEGPAWDAQMPLARAFGFPIAISEVGDGGLSGMLQDAALGAGIPALTAEFSGQYVWEEASVRAGVTGTLNAMKHLDMLDGEIEPQTEIWTIEEPLTDRRHVAASKGGIVEPLIPIGEQVESGTPVVNIRDLYGEIVETVSSPTDGWVITYPFTGNRSVSSGDSVFFVFAP